MTSAPTPNINRTIYTLHDDVVAGITQADVRFEGSAVRAALADSYGLEGADVRVLTQVHGNDVVVADTDVDGLEGDALIARADGFLIAVKVADCCPILLYDPPTRAMAAIHSGWRGTRENIAQECVSALCATYGCRPETILALVGPCAGGDRYVVRDDVASLFPDAVRSIGNGEYLFDNRSVVTRQLIEAGLPAMHITHDSSCTIADARYHSYRRDGQRAGRCYAYIGHVSRP
ncbi:MAG: polyphenol oxidase family protein [Candidatus Kapabacteria bacterium]|nr:polyphenol oxidase family protein [Candidatus Kapabacteria bacterium]